MIAMRTNYAQGTYLSKYPSSPHWQRGAAQFQNQTLVLHRLSRRTNSDGSIPAQVKYQGRTISGWVRLKIPPKGQPTLVFVPR